MEDENFSLSELIGWLLHKFDLEVSELAAYLNVHPTTIEKWLAGRPLDLACASTILELLSRNPERILPLLELQALHPEGDGASWPEKIAAARLSTGLGKTAFAGLLGAAPDAVRRWEVGRAPASCYAVLINLLYAHPREVIPLLQSTQVRPTARAPWTKKRLQALLGSLGMASGELATTLGLIPASVNAWMSGHSTPGACTAFWLALLEIFPEAALKLLSTRAPGAWTPERLRAARGRLTMKDLETLTGVDVASLSRWENAGLPAKYSCPTLIYAALERFPRRFLELAEQLG